MAPPPRRPVRAPPPDFSRSRRLGAVLGLAVGDALGIGLKGRNAPSPPFAQRAVGFREMLGRGPFNLAKGQVSDVTQLAAALAGSLQGRQEFDAQDALRRYRAWQPVAFSQSAYMKAALAAEGLNAGKNIWIRDGRRTADAGILTRATAIAVHFAGDRSRAISATLGDAQLTHFHPRAQLASVAMVAMIGEAIVHTEPEVPLDRLVEVAEEGLVEAAGALLKSFSEYTLDIQQGLDAVRQNLLLAQNADPELYGPEVHMWRQANWVDVPLRMAVFQLFRKRSFADALEDVVNRGGDAETNGGATGALLGAVQGQEAIPQAWKTAVISALHDKAGPLRDAYHPRKLVEIMDVAPEPEAPPPRGGRR